MAKKKVSKKVAPPAGNRVPAGSMAVEFGNVERAKMIVLDEINRNIKVLNQNMQTLISITVKNGQSSNR